MNFPLASGIIITLVLVLIAFTIWWFTTKKNKPEGFQDPTKFPYSKGSTVTPVPRSCVVARNSLSYYHPMVFQSESKYLPTVVAYEDF